jgi:hypothetical protein
MDFLGPEIFGARFMNGPWLTCLNEMSGLRGSTNRLSRTAEPQFCLGLSIGRRVLKWGPEKRY